MTLNDMLETYDTYTSRGLEERTDVRYFKDSSYRPKIHKPYGGWGIKPPKTGGFNQPIKPVVNFPKWHGEAPNFGYTKPKTGFGNNCGLGPGYVYDNFKGGGNEFSLKIRPDKPHKGYNFQHLNNTMHYHQGKRKPILDNNHIPFNWGYKKKKW